MAVLLTKGFARFARKAGLADDRLRRAAAEVVAGDFDADLGGGVFKQRIAREGSGKSGGYRTIIVFRAESHLFYVHGFAKKEKANVSARELNALKMLAGTLLALDEAELAKAIAAGEMVRIEEKDDGEGE